MDRKPPSGSRLSDYEQYRMKKYRDHARFLRPKREVIYVDGDRQYINTYDAMLDDANSPFGRNYILMNASPRGMLHVNRKKNTEHDWAPRLIKTDFNMPTIPKRAMSSMDLRRSETYTSAEDLRYHNVRKAGSFDDLLTRERYFSEVAPSESGISEIDSIFAIDDDSQSQSSICSADRSFCYSEVEEGHDRLDVLDVIEENEMAEDSGNHGSESLSCITNTNRRLSQGQINAGILTEELLKLKEAQEQRRVRKTEDIKEYIENNNATNRNYSTTSYDSCLGDSIRTDTDQSEYSEHGNYNTNNHGFKSGRKLTYSTDSGIDSRHESYKSHHDSEDMVTASVETTYLSDLPGVYEHEQRKSGEWWNKNDFSQKKTVEKSTFTPDKHKDTLTFKSKSEDDNVTTTVETIYLQDGDNLQYLDNETETVNIECESECKHNDSEIVQKSIETDYSEQTENKFQRSGEKFIASTQINSVIENNSENIEEITTETIHFGDQSVQLCDESPISDSQPHNSCEISINTQMVSDTVCQMSEDNLFTKEHVLNTHENLKSINLTRAEQNLTFSNQSELSLQFNDELELADDRNSVYYSQRNIDGKPTHDTETTVVVYNEAECTSTSVVSTELTTNQFTTNISYDENILEGKVEESNLSLGDNRHFTDHSGRNDEINTSTVLYTDITTQKTLGTTQYKETIKNSAKTGDIIDSEDILIHVEKFDIVDSVKDLEENGEQFIDNVKSFEQVEKSVIGNWNEDVVKVGVDRKEYFITEVVTSLQANISKKDINNVCFDLVTDIRADKLSHHNPIILDFPFTEKYIDRCENFIDQSDDRVLIRHNTLVHQLLEQVDSSIDYYECSGENVDSKEIKTDYILTKDREITLDSDNMAEGQDYSWTKEREGVYEEEEWDNLEDFRPQRQSGVKINVIKNKLPILTQYKMQTISENDEVDLGQSSFSDMYDPDSDRDSKVTTSVTHSNGIEISMIKTEQMNIAQYRVAQQSLDVSSVQDVNTCELEEAAPNVHTSPRANAEITETSTPFFNRFFKTTYHQNINSSQEFHLPVATDIDIYSSRQHNVHYKNLKLGEIGNENMGKTFQFVCDRPKIPIEWTQEQTLESKYMSTENKSSERIDFANISHISEPESPYKASCSAEVSLLEDSGYMTYLHEDSPKQSLLDISHDSDSSAYRSVCTAEVNVEIPGEEEKTETMLTSKSGVSLSPSSEISETESGYYTLTRSGKSVVSRQDTTEDMTSFVYEDSDHSLYKDQMFGVMNEESNVQFERIQSQEDITSYSETCHATSHDTSSEYLSGTTISRRDFNRIDSKEATADTLQEFIDFSESLGKSFELEEQKLLSEIESSEETSYVSAGIVASTAYLYTEAATSNEQNSFKTTVIEIFDSSEDLTGCIEFEVDDDGTGRNRRRSILDITKARSTEDLCRNLAADQVFTSRKYSVDVMDVQDGSRLGIRRVRSTEDMTSYKLSSEKTEYSYTMSEMKTHREESGALLHRQLEKANSTEVITSFENTSEATQLSTTTELHTSGMEHGDLKAFRTKQIEKADSTEDITSFENTSEATQLSTTTELHTSDMKQGDLKALRTKQIEKANSTEDITSFERTTEITDNSQLYDSQHAGLKNSRSLRKQTNSQDDEYWTTTTTTTETTTTTHHPGEEWRTDTETIDINYHSSQHDDLQSSTMQNIEQNTENRIETANSINYHLSQHDEIDHTHHGIETTTKMLQERQAPVLKLQHLDSQLESVDTIELLKSSKSFEGGLQQLLSSEGGIDHSEQFESMTDKDRNKIQMFIIYQDFAQMRERSRLKRQLGLLSKQFERLDSVDNSDKSTQLTTIDSFLDQFLNNLQVSEKLEVLKTQFKKVTSFRPVQYYDDDNEIYILMEKFSQILRELELHRDDNKLSAKLTYCLNFLKAKTIDGQFDSLCDFVCVESQKEDMELLQNHLCLTKEGDFGSRRLMKYLGRGFSTDMKTIWRPKLRTCLQTVCEDVELDFNSVSITPHKDENTGKPCCEFHGTDKGLLAELNLWSNQDSVNDLSPTFERRGIIN
ncbi:hypothetical protein LOTGIDRAFT_164584 [Lottia gigantea]|uniref:Uncharacterized protein n=1 Tax=Lottia gigantea TaxID=225164 RepID=V4A4J7_LOTGI|nr:hypothetical protein LOTGIDRAFT_164584 [Lottia gigantea]ESO89890.1 hypothetical protein LOTGIDRAFT_164584 [Lottia gigantea]